MSRSASAFATRCRRNITIPSSPAPRIGLAWSPDATAGKPGKTVIRLGAGFFYDRFGTNVRCSRPSDSTASISSSIWL